MAWSCSLKSLLTVFVFTIFAVPVSSVAAVTDHISKQKGCSADTCSALTFSATLGAQRRFSYENRCCTTEKCNQEDITPSSSSEPNGVECTACYNEKDRSCSSVTTLKCTGNEKRCIEVIGTDAKTSDLRLYGKGCATENTCNLKMDVLNDIQIQVSCIQAVSTSPVSTSTVPTSPVSNKGNPALKSISSAPIILLLLKVLL
ncbi:protein RoBo-1-like [Peromyscus californicus insignis]|uniref:protein RoBo-1-like n=1 Tax=Peromyscus californicus insignis TaxID=564181 RepID=UPI0022A73960|nr:protein RoBo-1-like [Peromyscus californicus insignis]